MRHGSGGFKKPCNTTGTATNGGYPEATFAWRVARVLAHRLHRQGATIVWTRTSNRQGRWGPCVDARGRAGNKVDADLKISIHGDGSYTSGAHGFHVIMPGKVSAGPADTSAVVEPSHRLGVLLRDGFQRATGQAYSGYIGKDGLDTRTDLGGLNLSRVPKVFIECGNMRHAEDARHMTDPQWRQQAAAGIAEAVTAFLAGS